MLAQDAAKGWINKMVFESNSYLQFIIKEKKKKKAFSQNVKN